MNKRYASVVSICCILVYCFALSFASIRIYRATSQQTIRVQRAFDALVQDLSSDAAYALRDLEPALGKALKREIFDAMVVTGPSGAEFVKELVPGLLTYDGNDPRIPTTLPFPYASKREALRSSAVRNATISVAYERISPSTLRGILRDSLLMVLFGLLVACISLILFLSKEFRFKATELPSMAEEDEGQKGESEPQESIHSAQEIDESLEDAYGVPPIAEPGAEIQETPPAFSPATQEGLYSPVTGVVWEAYMLEKLRAELNRSASFDQDLVLILLGDATADREEEDIHRAADAVVDFFSFRDLIFGLGGASFAVVLPNHDVAQGLKMVTDFLKQPRTREAFASTTLRAGLTARAGRMVEADRVIAEAKRALEKAQRDPTAPVVAFKPDPERYRSFIASI